MKQPRYAPGDYVMANNGRGPVYCINNIVDTTGGLHYDMDNGAVNIKKLRRGWFPIAKVDRYYKKVD